MGSDPARFPFRRRIRKSSTPWSVLPQGSKALKNIPPTIFPLRKIRFFWVRRKKGATRSSSSLRQGSRDRRRWQSVYDHLAKDYPELLRSSAAYYRDYLDRTISLRLPDAQIETAYDWARVSMLQGVVQNPFLGEGLVAGFNTSGNDHRPGFAWFFGRDAEWTSLALDAEGDFPTARQRFGVSEQVPAGGRQDPSRNLSEREFHGLVQETPFAYASADATPLFIIAVNDYVTHSGDIGFAQQKWDNLSRAYEFLRSTNDAQGLAQNVGVGTGWIEGGPLYPVRTEIYQASLGVEAARALSHLAHLLGKEDLAKSWSKRLNVRRADPGQDFLVAGKQNLRLRPRYQ